MTHVDFITFLTGSVRAHGAAATLDSVRRLRPPLRDGLYHDTLAVFFVWAVDRLVAGGLDDVRVLWHPLVHENTPRSWWDDATLQSPAAAAQFVPSTLARQGEPQPSEALLLAAA